MFRRVMTYQLILAVAVGPLLCCCTTGQLFASPAQQPASAPTSHHPAPKARVTSPCCAHKHQRAKSKGDHGHSDHKPVPSKPTEKCPCKDGAGDPDKIQTEVTSADASTLLRALTSDLVVPFAAVGGTSCSIQFGPESAISRGPNASLLSTADLLFSHHNLRC
jgi:hypothetical protein